MKQAEPVISFLEGTLSAPLSLPQELKSAADWRVDKRTDSLRCYGYRYHSLIKTGYTFNDQVADWHSVCLSDTALPKLRDYQVEACDAWLESRNGVLVMPTGSGKTEVAISLIERLRCSTLIICPLRALMYQWKERLEKALACKVGVIGDKHHHPQPITVTTYKSACIHMGKLGNRFELLVFDECHHLHGQILSDAARMSAAKYRLGLTATPPPQTQWETLSQLIGPIVMDLPIERIAGEHLAGHDSRKIFVELDEEERAAYSRLGQIVRECVAEMKENNPDFAWSDAQTTESSSLVARKATQAKRQRVAIEDRAKAKVETLEEILCLHPDAQAIIFVGSNQMGYELAQRFLIPCLLEHCDAKEREAILDGFRKREFRAVITNQILDEGIDVKTAKLAIILGGKSTPRQHIQRLGRILRKSGDEHAFLYEIICRKTGEVDRSRKRKKKHAEQETSTFQF